MQDAFLIPERALKQAGKEQQDMRKAFKSPEELIKRVDAYFDHCDKTREERQLKSGDIRVRQELPSMVGLAVYLGIGKSTLYEYAEGKYDKDISDIERDDKGDNGDDGEYAQRYSDILSCARDRIEAITLIAATNGDTDSRVALARLARFGYSTKVELDQKAALTVQWEGATAEDIGEWGV